MARECATAASTECTLYNNQDQKYFTNREISGLYMNPSWQCSLAFKQCWPCTEGSTEVQLGSPSPGSRVGPRQQCLLQEGTIHSAQAPSARDRAHLHLALLWSPPAHLARPSVSAGGSFGGSPACSSMRLSTTWLPQKGNFHSKHITESVKCSQDKVSHSACRCLCVLRGAAEVRFSTGEQTGF